MKKSLGLRLHPDLIARVDEARGDVSRTRFIERALEAALSPTPILTTPAGYNRTHINGLEIVTPPGTAPPRPVEASAYEPEKPPA